MFAENNFENVFCKKLWPICTDLNVVTFMLSPFIFCTLYAVSNEQDQQGLQFCVDVLQWLTIHNKDDFNKLYDVEWIKVLMNW